MPTLLSIKQIESTASANSSMGKLDLVLSDRNVFMHI